MTDARDHQGTGRRWRYRRSLASRVVLLTTIAVGLSVTFVSVGAFVTVRMQLKNSLDDSLVHRARAAAAQLDSISTSVPLGDEVKVSPVLLASSEVRVEVVGSRGTTDKPRGQATIPIDSTELAVARGDATLSLHTHHDTDADYRVVAVPVGSTGTALVLAQSLEPQEDLLFKLSLVSLFFGLAGIIAAGLAGWGVASNGLRPVRRLTTSVEEIAVTEDLTPLPVEGDDELARLSTAFNRMLASLGASRDRQRRLVADAGHELRTPLTSLRTNIDLFTQASRSDLGLSERARAELLVDVSAQIEELSTLVGDLVELARDEPSEQAVLTLDLQEVLDPAVARVRRRATSGVTVTVRSEPWYVEGEARTLERAITNLLDNAVKWSPPGGTVDVVLAHGELVVDDQGPGIADADLPHVFERFYRSSESRAMPGSGLGLSIVAQVVERHSGSITAGRSPAGGARLVLRLPGAVHPKPSAPPAVPPPAQPRSSSEVLVSGRRGQG